MKHLNNKNGLTFNVVDNNTGYGIDGAIFELKQNGKTVSVATSKLGGTIKFKTVFPGNYILSQLTAPEGYIKDNKNYNIFIDRNYILFNNLSNSFVIKNTKKEDN